MSARLAVVNRRLIPDTQRKRVKGKIIFVGFDTSQIFIDAMRAKQLHGIVVQNPFNMGYLGVRTMVDSLQGKTVEKRIDTGVTMITLDNLDAKDTQALLHPPLDQYLK